MFSPAHSLIMIHNECGIVVVVVVVTLHSPLLPSPGCRNTAGTLHARKDFFVKERPRGKDFWTKERPRGQDYWTKERPRGQA